LHEIISQVFFIPYFTGEEHPILWSFAHKKNGTVHWCLSPKLGFDENYNSTVPIAVQGDTDKPFIMVSFPGPQPNLHAVGNDYRNLSTSQISCMIHKKQIKIKSGAVTSSSYSAKKLAKDLFGGERFNSSDYGHLD